MDIYCKDVNGVYSGFCLYESRNVSESLFVCGKTKVLTLCFVMEPSIISNDHTFSNIPEYSYGAIIERPILPFVHEQRDDAKQLNGIMDMTFHIKPETIMYGGRYPPESIPLPQVGAVP